MGPILLQRGIVGGDFQAVVARLELGGVRRDTRRRDWAPQGGPIASVIGAALFTACTILFVWAGFLALRYCETVDIWRARCQDRNAARKADAAEDRAAGQAANRDRLTDAYLSRLRPSLLRSCTAPQMAGVENDIRAHLAGEQA